ncbi:MAG TPA: ankyrin repeat domain-containing protein [Gemmatimonadaceae bacterium]|nr:ankyrin repeat domain-containing protein [Gemmatimonadaceae bacterium]
MNRMQAFIAAIERGDAAAVRALLAADPMLATARDDSGATGLHFAAFKANREIIDALVAAGADVNARDGRHGATPAGWAVHMLRERGGLLAIEIEDVRFAIERGDAEWVDRLVTRHPALLHAVDRDGRPLRELADASGNASIQQLFRALA